MKAEDATPEFERLLDSLSYELTSARAKGLADPREARDILRRMRDLIANADSLASSVGAEKLKAEGFSGRAYDEL